jgi:DNA processing protein
MEFSKVELIAFSLFLQGKTDVFFTSPVEFKDKFFSSSPDKYLKKAEEIFSICEKKDIQIITVQERNYPQLLFYIYNPPLVLYLRGKLDLKREFISIVGSRRATAYGKKVASDFSEYLAAHGFGIISGMAFGIDSVSHKGALKGRGYTLSVLGCGVDIPYPASNKNLYYKIIQNGGGIISEYPPGTPAMKHYFPQRNRIIAGLSRGVIIVEAAKRSGSLITANFALESGRDVFAVPGNIDSPNSLGTNNLLKQGAIIVTSPQDILEEWGLTIEEVSAKLPFNLSKEEKEVLDCIPFEVNAAISPDNLSLRLKKYGVHGEDYIITAMVVE